MHIVNKDNKLTYSSIHSLYLCVGKLDLLRVTQVELWILIIIVPTRVPPVSYVALEVQTEEEFLQLTDIEKEKSSSINSVMERS